jgi:hypothetical protein
VGTVNGIFLAPRAGFEEAIDARPASPHGRGGRGNPKKCYFLEMHFPDSEPTIQNQILLLIIRTLLVTLLHTPFMIFVCLGDFTRVFSLIIQADESQS